MVSDRSDPEIAAIMIIPAIAVALLAFFLIGSEEFSAETITVDDSGGADYEKIQDAIDASQEGDTIRVYEGIYYENVVVDKTLTLIGNGSEETTVDGSYNGDVVKISVDWVNMTGFVITGGSLGSAYRSRGR